MQEAFVEFANKVKSDGLLIKKFGLASLGGRAAGAWTYSLQNESADVFASDIRIEEGGYRFNIHVKNRVLSNCELLIGGMYNVENAVAAVGVASSLEIDDE